MPAPDPLSIDAALRHAAFTFLQDQGDAHGDELPRTTLQRGFEFRGERVPLVGPQGIFKPRLALMPLSITTTSGGPYNDYIPRSGGLLHYSYRGPNQPRHRDNEGLRQALAAHTPLVYFFGLSPGRYLAEWPVYIVGDEPANETFLVALDYLKYLGADSGDASGPAPEPVRAYAAATYQRRLHQHLFRVRVLNAYRTRCALCNLRHEPLLDAAHIIPDRDPRGEPVVSNGLSLCKLHHTAYDRHFIGIDGDYAIKVRPDIMNEEDGPMLLHGLQGLDQRRIIVPHNFEERPDRASLDERYQKFLQHTGEAHP